MFNVYVARNSVTHKIYIGHTADLKKRFLRHNGVLHNKAKSFTYRNRAGGCWEVVYSENFANRKEAVLREKELKSGKGREYIKRVVLKEGTIPR